MKSESDKIFFEFLKFASRAEDGVWDQKLTFSDFDGYGVFGPGEHGGTSFRQLRALEVCFLWGKPPLVGPEAARFIL